MGEVDNLRKSLSRADLSSPSIQGAAAAMMKMYDRSSTLAVNEWRNQLQSCSTTQYLPLLYVANEVLQTSKRNRGTKFLEAFGPVLGPSLQFMCDREPSVSDKVRRTVKIWGDRQVFSLRFTTDLLHRLDNSKKPMAAQTAPPAVTAKVAANPDSMTEEEGMVTTQGNQDDGDTENSPFRNSGPSLLKVDNLVIDKETVLKAAEKSKSASVATFGMKRRRSQEASKLGKLTGSNPSTGKKQKPDDGIRAQDPHDFLSSTNKANLMRPVLTRRRSVLSTPNIIELLSHMAHLDREYNQIQNTMTSLIEMKLLPRDEDDSVVEVDDIVEVGDELIQLNQHVNTAIQAIQRDKTMVFSIADQKKVADGEIQKYLPFYKNSLKLDEQDIRLCEALEKKLKLLQLIHGELDMVFTIFIYLNSGCISSSHFALYYPMTYFR